MTRFAETGITLPGQSTYNSEIVSSIQRPFQDSSAHRDGSSGQESEAGKGNRFGPQVCASREAALGLSS
jgi:hypothetical protein